MQKLLWNLRCRFFSWTQIHLDNITEGGIQCIIRNSQILVDLILDRIHDEFSGALKNA